MNSIVLIGAPGSGKSSVGKALASTLDMPFTDTDAEISRERNQSIPEIFATEGEPGFRAIERLVVLQAVRENSGVISLGGGSILDSEVRSVLKRPDHVVIFLEVSLSNAAHRISRTSDRPLLAEDPIQKWKELVEFRTPIYRELADFTFSTDNKKPIQIANMIIEKIPSLTNVVI